MMMDDGKSLVDVDVDVDVGGVSMPPYSTPPQKKQIQCRYFQAKNGCRAGNACPFLHHDPMLHRLEIDRSEPALPLQITSQEGRQYVAPPVGGDRVVQKPVSSLEADNPREFQISQLRRRFNPIEKAAEDGATTLALQMAPSDPDFPFEMTGGLDCVLHVPAKYPTGGARPFLKVKNKEMGRGYQINVERGFDRLAESSPHASLLALMNSLDRKLESLLIEPKADVPVKFIIPAKQRKRELTPPQYSRSAESSTTAAIVKPAVIVVAAEKPPPPPSYTAEERTAAKTRRAAETRQLEARLGRLPLFFKSSNGIAYTVPLQPRKPMDLPVPLQAVKSVRLIVPLLYPLEPCKIEIVGVSREAAIQTEEGFDQKVKERSERNLMGHINFLAQEMHLLAIETVQAQAQRQAQEEAEEGKKEKEIPIGALVDPIATGLSAEEESGDVLPTKTQSNSEGKQKQKEKSPHDEQKEDEEYEEAEEKCHIKIIPRPPEWGGGFHDGPREGEGGNESDESDSSSSSNVLFNDDDDDDEDNDDDDDENDGQPTTTTTTTTKTTINNNTNPPSTATATATAPPPPPPPQPERGILLSFPSLELEGIEILEISSLSIRVKCERCKELKEVSRLRHGDRRRVESCEKCSRDLGIAFRRELLHAHSVKSGYLDLDGCVYVDMLPSSFLPTCSSCSTTFPLPGIISVRGDQLAGGNCRECHRKMSFKIPEIKTLLVSASSAPSSLNTGLVRKKPRENLGISTGQELPKRGACEHYKRSWRWFRFSCCSKVYPCDKCHDLSPTNLDQHPNEHGTRMICGLCSREQAYHPSTCHHCHANLVGNRSGNGFWEGGKGTRDRVRMNRKDPRKFKRRAAD